MSIIVGLTGGIASGKSTVSNMLKAMEMTVIDADVESRLAVEIGEPAYRQIIAEFGRNVIQQDGAIDRIKLASVIFHDEQKRQLLNQIVHPEVRKRMNRQKEAAIARGEKIVFLDIPLLFESQLTDMVDKTILVYVDLDVQLKRLVERNNLTMEEAEARIHSQMSLSEKVHLADKVINNNGSPSETKRQLIEILLEWGIDACRPAQ